MRHVLRLVLLVTFFGCGSDAARRDVADDVADSAVETRGDGTDGEITSDASTIDASLDTSTTSPEDSVSQDTTVEGDVPQDTTHDTSDEVATRDDVADDTVEDTTVVLDTGGEDVVLDDTVVLDTGLDDTTVEDTTIDDTTVEDTTIEDTTIEDTTIEDTSIEDTSIEDTTIEDTTVEDTTVEDTTVEDTTIEDTAIEDTTVEDTAVEDTGIEDSGADVACVPTCTGRVCGDDGCGDACGTCAAEATCSLEGRCLWSIHGRILYERRRPNSALSALGPVEVVALVGREVTLRVGATTLGVATTDATGDFTLVRESAPGGAVSALLVATSPVAGPSDVPAITLLDGLSTTFPTATNQPLDSNRIWAWTFSPPAATPLALDLGQVTITAAQGSGAIALLLDLEAARARAVALFVAEGFVDDVELLPNLGVFWSPTRTPSCLSCYFPEPWGPARLVDAQGQVVTVFDTSIFLSGAAAAPHHWTPSLSGHELGHWVMDVFSRLPDIGGAHAWNSKATPTLAWSEGFATFFAQWSLSASAPVPRFFSMQQNIQYWVDLDRIGTAPTNDDTSLPFTFPLPNAAGTMTQDINEAVIAAILWDLYDGLDAADGDTLGYGDITLADVALTRLATATQNRGVTGPDLVDYVDALVCSGIAWADLQSRFFGFPWVAPALCP